MEKRIYNLEFPSFCHEVNFFGYKFSRVVDYKKKLGNLQHIGAHFAEFNITTNLGSHAITAIASIPKTEEPAVLPWESESTAFRDVLFLLSLH